MLTYNCHGLRSKSHTNIEETFPRIFVYLWLVVEQCKVDRGNWQISGKLPISLKTILGVNVD